MQAEDDDEFTFFICESCNKKALRAHREIARDCGELIYEDVFCMECLRRDALQITREELLALPVKGGVN
jgi:hypothetical protein